MSERAARCNRLHSCAHRRRLHREWCAATRPLHRRHLLTSRRSLGPLAAPPINWLRRAPTRAASGLRLRPPIERHQLAGSSNQRAPEPSSPRSKSNALGFGPSGQVAKWRSQRRLCTHTRAQSGSRVSIAYEPSYEQRVADLCDHLVASLLTTRPAANQMSRRQTERRFIARCASRRRNRRQHNQAACMSRVADSAAAGCLGLWPCDAPAPAPSLLAARRSDAAAAGARSGPTLVGCPHARSIALAPAAPLATRERL